MPVLAPANLHLGCSAGSCQRYSKLWKVFAPLNLILLLFLLGAIIASLMLTRPHEIWVPPLDDQLIADYSSHLNSNDSILIIGAGAAGLFAGYTLEYFGMTNYRILEASSDFGGRVQEMTNFLDVPIDLGAEWIHGDPKVLMDLLLFHNDTVDIETISYQPQTITVFRNGRRTSRNWFRFFYREFKFRNTTWYSYLKEYVVPYVQTKLILNSPVMAIDYSGTHSNTSQIHVTTEDGRIFFADKVIMTVPLVVMNNTQLFPELPATKRQAMENVYIPSGLKVWIEFDEDFYSDMQLTGSLFGYNNDAPFFFDSVFRKPSSRHCLTYFDVSPNTHKLTGLDDDEILSKLIQKLDNIFDGKATHHYLNHHVQNWEKQPYIGGAYSFGWDNYDWTLRELQRPINKKLYFAGEHTEPVEVATVHGAAISGRQAAQEVLKDLQ